MKEKKKRTIKPASTDPRREAMGHPDGPSLTEMFYGEEEKKLSGVRQPKKDSDDK